MINIYLILVAYKKINQNYIGAPIYKKSSKCSTYIKIKLDNTIEDYDPKHNHNIE